MAVIFLTLFRGREYHPSRIEEFISKPVWYPVWTGKGESPHGGSAKT
jgi:hypothetical protein